MWFVPVGLSNNFYLYYILDLRRAPVIQVLIFFNKLLFIIYFLFLTSFSWKVWWPLFLTLLAFSFIHTIHSHIHTFLHQWTVVEAPLYSFIAEQLWQKPPWGAESGFELGSALQRVDVLPTEEPCRTWEPCRTPTITLTISKNVHIHIYFKHKQRGKPTVHNLPKPCTQKVTCIMYASETEPVEYCFLSSLPLRRTSISYVHGNLRH